MKITTIEGKPVIEARRSLNLRVLIQDVMKGRKKNPYCCAASEACKRQFKVKKARVNITRTYLLTALSDGTKAWIRYFNPPSLVTEIKKFDRTGRFMMAEYRLTPPSKSVRESFLKRKAKKNKNKQPVKGGDHKKRAYHFTSGVRAKNSMEIW